MSPDLEFDVDRYRKLLADATDDEKRLALIRLLIEEGARERLEATRSAEQDAMTAATITKVLAHRRADLQRLALWAAFGTLVGRTDGRPINRQTRAIRHLCHSLPATGEGGSR
jgi:hypothetical protein